MRIDGRFLRKLALAGVLVGAMALPAARAEEATVAVAANFLAPLDALVAEFETATPHRITVTSGSTGQLYAQIVNGAPFDILLAADRERPRLLAEAGAGDASSVFTYAVGRLALWSRDPDLVGEDTLTGLAGLDFRWLAIAEPELAPYGAAAKQTLENLGAWAPLASRIVKGQNIAQTFAMVETGNADLGLVALSQALAYDKPASYAVVPASLHDPIRQDAILLQRALENAAAVAFLEFMQTAQAREILERYGYSTPAGP